MRAQHTRCVETLEDLLGQRPDDWDSWLVYADWLTDAGDLRGTLIGLEHRLSVGQISAGERQALEQQIDTMISSHLSQWLSGWAIPRGTRFQLLHGFVWGVWLGWNSRTLARLSSLAAHPSGRFLSRLSLLRCKIGADGATLLAGSDTMRVITSLDLGGNKIRTEGLGALLDSPHLRGITELGLGQNALGDDGAVRLVRSDLARTLVSLDLSLNGIGSRGLRALSASDSLAALVSLDLSGNDLAGDELSVLHRSLPMLRHLTSGPVEGSTDESRIRLLLGR